VEDIKSVAADGTNDSGGSRRRVSASRLGCAAIVVLVVGLLWLVMIFPGGPSANGPSSRTAPALTDCTAGVDLFGFSHASVNACEHRPPPGTRHRTNPGQSAPSTGSRPARSSGPTHPRTGSVPPQPASLPPPPRPASPPSSGRRLGSALPWASGVFASPETPAAAAAFGTWRGRPLNVVTTWSGRSTWQDIVDPSWLYQRWTGSPYTMVFGVAMLPERVSGVSLQKCASGSYNSYWRQFGQVISSYHLGTSIIRLGWEFNGDWYVWAATSPATWVSCWRNIVTSTRATAPGLKWDWNVNRGVSAGLADPTRAYPGNSYVNIVGVDSYDNWPPATTPAGWQTQLNGTQGLDYWLAFAKAHDKPLSVPEWGNVCGTSSGGDDPQYVRYMRAFFAANAARLAYEANFQSPTTCGTYAPGTTVPNSAAAYKAGFGG
jgi:hypothetical protein